MRIVQPELNLIKIGYQGENEATCVRFDVSAWPGLYGEGGSFALRHQRAGDPDGYPVIVTEEDGTVSWVVSNIDTKDPGYGKATLVYTVGDVVAMSVEYATLTEASVGENPEPPEPWKPWIDEILEARDEAVEAAEDAHEDANSASQSADDASTEALKAEGYAVGTQDGEEVGPDSPYYQKNAKYYYEEIADEMGPVQSHLTDHNNPHQVTPSQIGAIEKVTGAVANDLAMLTEDGGLADSGISADYLVPVKAKSGSVIEFNSDGAVPLKSALLKGKTAAINQLLTTGSIAKYTSTGITVTYTDNKVKFAETGSGYKHARYTSDLIEGHRYLFRCSNATTTKAGASFTEMWLGSKTSRTDIYGDLALGANDIIFTALKNPSLNATVLFFSVYLNSESYDVELTDTQLIDLTLCGFTSAETTDVATLKTAWLAKYGTPLPQYIPYNAGSIVSNNATYQLCGKNLFDKDSPAGTGYFEAGGTINPNTRFSYYYIPVKEGDKISISGVTANNAVYFIWLDANKSFLSAIGQKQNRPNITVPSGAAYLGYTANNLTATVPDVNTAQIELGATATTYEPYHDGGTIVADSLNGIGTVTDEQDEQGNITRRFGVVDLGALNWTYASNRGGYMWAELPLKKKNTPMVCARYKYIGVRPDPTYDEDKVIALESQSTDYIDVHDTAYTDAAAFKTAMSGVYLVYELATPTTDTTTPATLTTQKGYNALEAVSGDVQNGEVDISYYNGLAAVIIEALNA